MPSRIFVNSEHSWQNGEGILLSKDQKHYFQKVLRLHETNQIEVVNKSTRQVFIAELMTGLSTATLLSEITTTTAPATLNLIFAYCKSTKNETIIEKCTELGVDNFIIYQAKHSVAKLNDNKTERLEKIAEAASCQSKRNSIPNIQLAKSQKELEEILQGYTKPESLSLVGSLQEKQAKIPTDIQKYQTINLAVGPEGDFTEEEYQLFNMAGFLPVSLGQNILRAETAAIAATSYFCIHRAQ